MYHFEVRAFFAKPPCGPSKRLFCSVQSFARWFPPQLKQVMSGHLDFICGPPQLKHLTGSRGLG